MNTVINSPDAPATVGPYVQAVKVNGLIFVSGCIPLEPDTNTLCPGGNKRTNPESNDESAGCSER